MRSTKIRYYAGAALAMPMLPIMYIQGKKIRARVPRLQEAAGPLGRAMPPNDSKKELRLLTLGESTIAGVGVQTHEEGFTGTLARELASLYKAGVSWEVCARSGYTARKVAEKLVPNIKGDGFDMVVIGLGGNDAFKLNHPETWKQDIKALLDKLREKFPEAAVFFCNMPPIKEFPAFSPLIKLVVGNLVEILGEELDALVQQYDQVFYANRILKLRDWLGNEHLPADFFSDGVHPSVLTYQLWAAEMAQEIYNSLQ